MAKKRAQKTEPPKLSIEESMGELQDIVRVLEEGEEPLESSLKRFERGMCLLRQCHEQLESAAARIEMLTSVDADGNPRTKPFDGKATHSESAGPEELDSDSEEPALF